MSSGIPKIVPRPAKPLYPDVPWWAVLISAFVFSIVGVVIGAYAGLGSATAAAGKISAASLAVDTVSYIPHILLLFGVLGDMFTLQGVWSIPSLVGILSIFANYVFVYFWRGLDELIKTGNEAVKKASNASGAAAADAAAPSVNQPEKGSAVMVGGKRKGGALFVGYNGCAVQGLEVWNTKYAPQTLVVTATIFAYYCFDLIRNRGWINSIGAILAFFTAFFAQAAVIGMNTNSEGCADAEGVKPGGVIAPAVRAMFEGLMFGGVSYAIVQTYAPARLPSSVISPFPAKSASDLTPGPDGRMYDSDGYPYHVLPNGMAVPDMSDPSARAAFGQLASEGTGTALSVGSGCPAVSAKGSCPK